MYVLSNNNINNVCGAGFHLTVNLGTAIATLAVGIITGGPAGLGIAACGLVMAQGVNQLDELINHKDKLTPEYINANLNNEIRKAFGG